MDDLIRRQDAADFLCDWCGICPKEKRNIMECDDIAPNFAKIPTVDAVEVVRCKDCKYRPISYGDEHDLCFPEEYHCPCQCDDNWYSWMPKDDFFCARGERRDDHDAHNPKGIHA